MHDLVKVSSFRALWSSIWILSCLLFSFLFSLFSFLFSLFSSLFSLLSSLFSLLSSLFSLLSSLFSSLFSLLSSLFSFLLSSPLLSSRLVSSPLRSAQLRSALLRSAPLCSLRYWTGALCRAFKVQREFESTTGFTFTPSPVWDLLLPQTPDRRDHWLLVSLPKDTSKCRVNEIA